MNNEPSDQWTFELMDLRSNGPSDYLKWASGLADHQPVDPRTSGPSG